MCSKIFSLLLEGHFKKSRYPKNSVKVNFTSDMLRVALQVSWEKLNFSTCLD